VRRFVFLLCLMGATQLWGAIGIDVTVFSDRSSSSTNITSPPFSTTFPNELLLAFVSADARSAGVTVTSVSGANLTWVLVQRSNVQMGTAEIWRAFASAPLPQVTVRANLSQRVAASITVVTFTGTDTSGTNGAGAIGASAFGSASSGAPTATLVSTRANSWVFGVGNDWDNAIARTVDANQTMVHQYLATVGDCYWVQRQIAPTPLSGTGVTIQDIGPTTDRYDLAIIEILPALTSGTTGTYTIAGAITPATNSAGATVTLSGTASATTTADVNGNYSFTSLASGTYMVTPSKSGFSLSPASQNVTINGANQTANFTATPQTWTIQGTVSGGIGATVTLSGAASATTTADASGAFSFSGLVNGSYTVTPTMAGFTISPASRTVSVNNAPVTGVNFTAGPGLAIDVVAYGDTNSASTTAVTSSFSTTGNSELLLALIATDASSSGMTITGVTGGGLTWALVRRTNAQLGTAEVWSAFAASPLSNISVTGTLSQRAASSVTVVGFRGADSSGTSGSGAIGASASASASAGAPGGPKATLVTTRNNSWVIGVGNDWDNAIARTLGPNQTMVHQLLASVGDTYWVQRQSNATSLSGTSVSINDTAPTGDRYNLTIVEVLPAAPWSISGNLSPASDGAGTNLTLAGTSSAATTADASGNYSFSALTNGAYSVAPSTSVYSFSPVAQFVAIDGANVANVNFTVSGGSPPPIAVSISPVSALLSTGGKQQFTATVTGTTNTAVTWSATGGTISSSGFYTAPGTASTYTVTATSVADASKSASATVTVTTSAAGVSISPVSALLSTGGTQQFTATVTGTTNTAVTWSATGGTVSSSGFYTAPGTAGTYTVEATSVADTTKSASATVTVTPRGSSSVLLGDPNVESQADSSLPLGQAEAFQATANASGNVQSLALYLDSTSTVSQMVAGLYADAGGHPGSLLSQGSSAQVVAGAWNPISLPVTSVVAGTPYWVAILGTTSGTLVFRDATQGGCASETSAQNSLTSLPSTWTTGTASSTCPISAFGDGTKVVFFDTFAGTTLSPNWTVISRHGEYLQNETECNIPQQVTVASGLTITTAAQTWTCGDFHPDGTVWRTPSAWPYITGDVQWTSLNFTYGTVEIRAKFPAAATSLWPATWLLGSNCQSTNPYTGDTGVGTCPNVASSGYTEIDMTECYGSGWCQFHVANPGFGIGNGCDATYTVDTNFHTFDTVWNASGITQYMDGVAVTTCKQKLSNPMFLIIQTQTGGSGGTPNNALLPATLVVDYVKVTQP
jgi:hypothetical protein